MISTLNKFYKNVLWTWSKKIGYTHINYLCRNQFGGGTYLPIFAHTKLSFDEILHAICYVIGCQKLNIFTHFLPYPPLIINKKILTAHPNISNHKRETPLRPILSTSGTYNYNMFGLLVQLLAPLTSNSFVVKDSFTFVEEICIFFFNQELCSG